MGNEKLSISYPYKDQRSTLLVQRIINRAILTVLTLLAVGLTMSVVTAMLPLLAVLEQLLTFAAVVAGQVIAWRTFTEHEDAILDALGTGRQRVQGGAQTWEPTDELAQRFIKAMREYGRRRNSGLGNDVWNLAVTAEHVDFWQTIAEVRHLFETADRASPSVREQVRAEILVDVIAIENALDEELLASARGVQSRFTLTAASGDSEEISLERIIREAHEEVERADRGVTSPVRRSVAAAPLVAAVPPVAVDKDDTPGEGQSQAMPG